MGNPRGVKRNFDALLEHGRLAARRRCGSRASRAGGIAGLTLWNFYFQIFENTIGSEQVIEFLTHLLRHIPGKLLLVWDRLPAHRSRLTQQFIRAQRGRLVTEFLPPYAPELNPVEYLWAHCKHHELPNVCAKNLWDLTEGARRTLKRMRRRPRLIVAFWKQACLFE